jgi:hypothetical protein
MRDGCVMCDLRFPTGCEEVLQQPGDMTSARFLVGSTINYAEHPSVSVCCWPAAAAGSWENVGGSLMVPDCNGRIVELITYPLHSAHQGLFSTGDV